MRFRSRRLGFLFRPSREFPSKQPPTLVAAGGNGAEPVGSEAVGPPVTTHAGTLPAAVLQLRATRPGALGDGRTVTGSTEVLRADEVIE